MRIKPVKMTKSELVFSIIIPIIQLLFYIFFIVALIVSQEKLVIAAMIGSVACSACILISPLLIARKLYSYEMIEIGVAATLTTTFVIIFVCSLPETYRGSVSTIAGSVMGGLFTLFGVGLTIKFNRLVKLEDDKKKAKPHVFPISYDTLSKTNGFEERYISTQRWVSDLKEGTYNDKDFCIDHIYLANSDLAMCIYEGIIINDHYIYFDNGTVLLRGMRVDLWHDINFKLDEKITRVSLILRDMLDNQYRADMEFRLNEYESYTDIEIVSTLEIVDLEVKFYVPVGQNDIY